MPSSHVIHSFVHSAAARAARQVWRHLLATPSFHPAVLQSCPAALLYLHLYDVVAAVRPGPLARLCGVWCQAKAEGPHGVASPDSSHIRHQSTSPPFRLQWLHRCRRRAAERLRSGRGAVDRFPCSPSRLALPRLAASAYALVTGCKDIRTSCALACLYPQARRASKIEGAEWAGGPVGRPVCLLGPIMPSHPLCVVLSSPGESFVVPLLAALAAGRCSLAAVSGFGRARGLQSVCGLGTQVICEAGCQAGQDTQDRQDSWFGPYLARSSQVNLIRPSVWFRCVSFSRPLWPPIFHRCAPGLIHSSLTLHNQHA